MHLFNLLENKFVVCRDHILSFLTLKDLLRFRRVCKFTKDVSADYFRTHQVQTQRPLEIDFHDYPNPFGGLTHFQEVLSEFPSRKSASVSRIDILKYYSPTEQAAFQKCVEALSPHLTCLKIQNEFSFKFTEFLTFCKMFPNVTNMTLEVVRLPSISEDIPPATQMELESALKNLKVLEILDKKVGFSLMHKSLGFFLALMKACSANVEQVSLPFERMLYFVDEDEEERNNILASVVHLACTCLSSTSNLKILNGLDGALISHLLIENDRTPEMGTLEQMIENINAKVASIINPKKSTFQLVLPNLEKIEIEGGLSFVEEEPEPRILEREVLPKLKEIRAYLTEWDEGDNNDPLYIQAWDFLFAEIRWTNVIKLDLYIEGYHVRDGIRFDGIDRSWGIPALCPNLLSLRIGGYFARFINLRYLWIGLPRLEKLTFNYCLGLKDAHFFEEDAGNVWEPTFWSLESLKVLEFEGMNSMNVTDQLFRQALRHMPLKELHLSNSDDTYCHSITLKGIKALLSGRFASTIERLSIADSFYLPGVSKEEMKNVERMFRSSQMI